MKNNTKTLRALVLVALVISIVTACRKEEHRIRVKNDYVATFTSISIGNVSFENVEPGVTTEYRDITPGDFSISGKTTDNKVLSGNGKVTGRGRHQWTITANANGVQIQEDK